MADVVRGLVRYAGNAIPKSLICEGRIRSVDYVQRSVFVRNRIQKTAYHEMRATKIVLYSRLRTKIQGYCNVTRQPAHFIDRRTVCKQKTVLPIDQTIRRPILLTP